MLSRQNGRRVGLFYVRQSGADDERGQQLSLDRGVHQKLLDRGEQLMMPVHVKL